MANPFYYSGEYTYSGAFIPGTLARAEQLTSEFTSVQTAFADFAYQGIDTGAANAYVVTTGGAPSGAYADGQLVQFKAVNASTGACTINVNGIGVVALTRANGSASQAGDVTANTWFTAAYNSNFSCWTIITPVPVTGFTNTISGAAPTHLVGLTAAGGVANAAAPIDVTFALDQSISPTWTGTHTFSGNVSFNSTVSFTGGQALTGLANHYALILDGSATTGQSFGLEINAGTNASDMALVVNNQSGGTQFLEITGVGSVVLGGATGGGQGLGTLNAAGLYINGVAVSTSSSSGANPTATIGLTVVNGSATTFMRSDAAPPLSQAIAPTMTGKWIFTPSSAVTAVTVNAAVNTSGLALVGGTNTSAAYLMTLETGQGSGFSSGLLIQGGTSNADYSLTIANAAATSDYFIVRGDGVVGLGVAAASLVAQNAAGGYPGLQLGTGGVLAQDGAGVFLMGNCYFNGSNYVALQTNVVSVLYVGDTIELFVSPSTTAGQVATPVECFTVTGVIGPTIKGYGPVSGGLVDMTPDQGTFTITYTGFTSSVTGTAHWTRVGNLVILLLPAGTGTSNAATFTATGLPSAIQPSSSQHVAHAGLAEGVFENNSGETEPVDILLTGASGTITFGWTGIAGANSWTSSGTKGLLVPITIAYLLN
jgi:hypothetical protein